MPSLNTTPSPESYDFLASAHAAHAARGYDFAAIFDDYFGNHLVFKAPDYFIMARADPDPARDAWLVWWAENHPPCSPAGMIRKFLRLAPHYRPRIGWARGLRGREEVVYYSTDRLLRFIGRINA